MKNSIYVQVLWQLFKDIILETQTKLFLPCSKKKPWERPKLSQYSKTEWEGKLWEETKSSFMWEK